MSAHDSWTDQLSDYLDDELTADERRALEAHLAGCPDCSAVLDDLRRVVERARTLTPRPPAKDLWDGIAGGIDAGATRGRIARFQPRAARRFAFTLPQLAAASLLIAAMSGGIVAVVSRQSSVASQKSAVAGSQALAQTDDQRLTDDRRPTGGDLAVVALADEQYDAAVADLQRVLKQGRGRLDPATIAILEHNLETIDNAIEQAREALAADPANTYLSSHLVETRRRKLDLLRRATALTTEMD